MSTKTSIKRIALVAVAALGFGMVSTVAASAASASVSLVKTSGLSSVVGAGTLVISTTTTASDTATASSYTFASTDVGKALYSGVTGYIGTIATYVSAHVVTLSAAGVGGNVTHASGVWYKATPASTYTLSGVVANEISSLTVTAGTANILNLKYDAATAATTGVAKAEIGATKISSDVIAPVSGDLNMLLPITAPVAAGSYTVKVTYDNGGTYSATSPSFTFTLVVAAAADFSAALSTSYMGAAGDTSMTATTNAVPRSASKTNGTAIASIEITLKKSDGTTDAQAHTITATVTGSGYVKADATSATGTAATTRVSTNSSASGTRYVHIGADGTAGTGTVTVTLTNVNTLAVTTLGTWSFSTYGSATKLEVSTTNYTIGRFGGYTTGWTGDGTRASETKSPLAPVDNHSAPAFIVKATDSSGNPVSLTSSVGAAIVPSVISSDTAVVTGGTCVLDAGSTTYGSSTNGVGYYNCSFTSAANSVSGGKATLTIRTPNPADTSTYLTATLAVSLGGKASTGTETLSLDSASYEPGAGMTVKFTCVDSAKNPCADGIASPAVTFNKQTGGSAALTGWYIGGVDSSDSLGQKTVYAPAVDGDFFATATASSLAALTANATVSGTNGSGAAIDAANEATDAANAATDAANAAAEAADAATAAAQDAQAAVAALATSVSSLIAGIKAQITSLTNLVIKIQKKVKA